jgi:hypothetical protein
MSEDMVRYEAGVVERSGAMSLKQVTDRVNLVHQVLERVMKENTHYGKIDGCGRDMVLFKPGADLLAMTFRLSPSYTVDRHDDGEHREYEVTCTMTGPDGSVLGQGVGSASTKEKKYRYRWEGGKWDATTKRKVGAVRIENEDIADVYNTVLKMAKKRAHVDATLTATGAADLFTQDLIDEDVEQAEQRTAPKPPTKKAAPKQSKKHADGEMEAAEVVVERVGSKGGVKGTRYWIEAVDGQYYSTFSDTIGADVLNLQPHESVKIEFERTQGAKGEFRTIKSLELVPAAEPADDVGF